MIGLKHKSTFTLKKSTADRKWYLINAEGQTLGRLASKVARILRGKNKTTFTPHVDSGDFVVIINSDKIKVTGGSKAGAKTYYRYSGYAGGMKSISLEKQMAKDSRRVIMEAVGGMMPKGRLANKQLTKCKIFKGAEHNHIAQSPVTIEL